MSSGRRRAILCVIGGVVAGVLVVPLIGFLVMASGLADAAATHPSGALDTVLAYAADRSIAHHAGAMPGTLPQDPDAIRAGLRQYREMCLTCHGAPGIQTPDYPSSGMNPSPPDLASKDAQSISDGTLFYVIKHGIRMTGMPAAPADRSDTHLRGLVAAVRRLPSLSQEEKDTLQGQAKR